MVHILFFLLFAALTAVAFGIFTGGATRDKVRHGLKVFAEFVGIGLALAWVCYFLPG